MSRGSPDRQLRELPLLRRPRVVKLAGWLLGIGLFLLILPEIVRFALIRTIPEMGLGRAGIEDVDLNLFDASAGITGLTLEREGETKLALAAAAVDISWLKLLLGQVSVESVQLQGVRLTARQLPGGDWELVIPLVTGTASAEDSATGGAPLPRILLRQLVITDSELAVDSEVVSGVLGIRRITLENASTWLPAPLTLELRGSWRQAPLALLLSAEPWAAQPGVAGELHLESLPLAGINAVPDVTLAGALKADLSFSARQADSGINATVGGDLEVEGLSADYRHITLTQEQLSWDGAVSLALPPEDAVAYTVQGDVHAGALQVRDQQQAVDLLRWKSLSLRELSLDQAFNAGFRQLTLSGADMLDAQFHTGELRIDGADLRAARRLTVAGVDLSRGDYSIVIDQQGRLRAEQVLNTLLAGLGGDGTTQAEAATPTDAAAQATQPLLFSIDTLRVAGDTSISLVDQRFAEPVEQQVVIKELAIDTLDQIDPERQTHLSLLASVGEFSKLTAAGQARPFAEQITADIKGELKGMELPELSPYSAAYLGYELTRGHYDHDFAVMIDKGEVDFNNTLHLRQLALESVNPDKPQPIEQQLDLPLGLALDMLRDGDDNIELEVLIQGRLNDPDVDINRIINDALAKAVKRGATSYLTYALQPYGAILMAAEMVGEQVNAVRLEPMLFDPGVAEIPAQRNYIEKLQGLLEQRPKLSLSLCGRANRADRIALFGEGSQPGAEQEKALLDLAGRRARNLKRLFVERGLPGERVLLCQTQFAEQGISGVQLQM